MDAIACFFSRTSKPSRSMDVMRDFVGIQPREPRWAIRIKSVAMIGVHVAR